MTRFLGSLAATLAMGILLLLVVAWGFDGATAMAEPERYARAVFLFLHFLAGALWIGLLYYVHLVQFPALQQLSPEQEDAIYRTIAPEAFFWLRHAALVTIVTGLLLGFFRGQLLETLLLKGALRPVGLGLWIGIYMALSSWFLVWPNQRKVGAAQEKGDPARAARALWHALLFSRINLMLSLPMLYTMLMPAALGAGGQS